MPGYFLRIQMLKMNSNVYVLYFLMEKKIRRKIIKNPSLLKIHDFDLWKHFVLLLIILEAITRVLKPLNAAFVLNK